MTTPTGIVYLLDDEPAMVKALTRLLRSKQFTVQGFTSVNEFFAAYQPQTLGCLVLDVAMPELNGLDLQQQLTHHGIVLPIIFLTGHGDIPMSVRAIKAGASDFFTKPVDAVALVAAVRAALQKAVTQHQTLAETAELAARWATLTPREREVMAYVVAGQLNKQIAAELGIVEETVKVHRGRVMAKMKVSSVADLVRAAERLRAGQ